MEMRKRRRPERTSSSVSVVSAASGRSRDYPPVFSMEPDPSGTKMQMRKRRRPERTSSSVSVVSAASGRSRDYPPVFSREPDPSGTNEKTTIQKQDTLKVFESKAMTFMKQALRPWSSPRHEGLLDKDVVDKELLDRDGETNEAALQFALRILRTMNADEHAHTLEKSYYGELVFYQRELKSFLKMKHSYLLETMDSQLWPMPLKKIYTRLYLIEGDSGEVNIEHEVRQIETAFRRQRCLETLIKSEDLFKPLLKQEKPIRTLLTKGIAGIGKTVLAQKFMLDWSEGKANQDFQLLFSLPFRELNLLRNQRCSLMELLNDFSPGLGRSGITGLEGYKVLFILDGLDECRLRLDFNGCERCCDASHPASVDVLLTSLIAGDLLPNASLWVTSRPAAAGCIPSPYVHRVTEIRGFNNQQKEQYFYKKIEDENLAKRVIANIKSTRSLYIMCHVPMFCWISSIVLERMCEETPRSKMPKTLTQMYIHFLTQQTTKMYTKYCDEQQLDSLGNNKVIMSLGKLAFQQLEKGNLIFYEEDLIDCGINVKEASVYSGVCTQVFREESCLQQKVFCFVHLSIQEFLAALYVHVMYKVKSVNLMMDETEWTTRTETVSGLHKAAVERALQSDSGHLDLFLRFLLGLSLRSSQDLLKALSIHVETCDPQSQDETVQYIKERINENLPPEKYINLFHCLNELNDLSLMEEIQSYLDLDRDSMMDECSAARWAALVFLLMTSPEKPEEIHLKKYSRTEEGLARLIPAIQASRSARLNDCNLTVDSCQLISSALSSRSNELSYLNLSDNSFQDSGVEVLSPGLKNFYCRLKTLRLNRCSLTQRSCEYLATVLRSEPSHLQELDLSHNDIQDSGVKLLCSGLEDVSCRLETLRLSFCEITEESCGVLASAVTSNPSHLRELDLSYNHLGDSGPKLISEALEEAGCQFTKLKVDHNGPHWFKSGLKKYACELTLDPNTAHELLVLSDDNQKASQAKGKQPYPNHPDRFDYWPQVMFQQGLTSRCYWEMEWEGNWAGIGVTYKSLSRKGPDNDCLIGYNKISWSLHCSVHGYRAYHNFKSIVMPVPLANSRRLAVYLDWDAGILSFFRVSPGQSPTHLHTFVTKFTEPLYPVFRVWGQDSSLRICVVDK